MEVLWIFGSSDQEIEWWFTNHDPLIPTLCYVIKGAVLLKKLNF